MIRTLKTIIVLAVCLAIITPSAALSANAADLKMIKMNLGDVDGNGDITAVDARIALRISAQLESNASEYRLYSADFNQDGSVTAVDARIILRISASLESHPYDKSEAEKMLEKYTEIMNDTKTKKPGFTSINYQNSPKEDIKIHIDQELKDMFKSMTGEDIEESLKEGLEDVEIETREDALKNAVVTAKNSDMNNFPLPGIVKGCTLTDVTAIEDFTTKNLPNGNVLIEFKLIEEKNLKATTDYNKPQSYLASVFDTLSNDMLREEMDKTMKGAFDEALAAMGEYHFDIINNDCTSALEYNPQTNTIVSLKQIIKTTLDMSILDGAITLKQSIYQTTEWFSFK